jgi:hypothetical protein
MTVDSLALLAALTNVPSADAVKSVPDIIAAASKSTLGILALIILGLAVLAWAFFKKAKEIVRIGIFVMLFAGAALYTWAIIGSSAPAEKRVQTESSGPIVIAGTIVEDAGGGSVARAEVTIAECPEPVVSDDTGRFQLTCGSLKPDSSKQLNLRVTKDQYDPKDWSVAQISQSLSIPLVRHRK